MDKNDKYLLSSVNNALKILDILSVKDDIGLAEIARISNLDKTSVFKMLYTLEHRDYVYKTADAKYRLGVKFANFGNIVANRTNLADSALPYMKRLEGLCNETVCLGVLNTNGKVIVTNLVEGTKDDHVVSRIGYEMDAYNNANGKLLLANLDESMLKSMLNFIHFQPRTPFTQTSKDILELELKNIRSQPYVEQYEQFMLNQADIAAPIRDSTGKIIAAISIVCLSENLIRNHDQYISLLCRTAEEISNKLGYTVPPRTV